ncbi:MAG: hypothetical protein CPDRYMAC_2412 [uncultured Paraburkholderia sp.]|nr:MAG: hypothetical protein CPDRYDRY_2383 [uncultured Paraburkholderia sp.]CAH2924778.1 MAG: hypothetical protein CPDRYMAC_2412 [uncultured Paraburkholderia sp.]
MQWPELVEDTERVGKTQTTRVGVEDERDRSALSAARNRVWFYVQHLSFFCQFGTVPRWHGVSCARCMTRAHQQVADEAKAKHMPKSEFC